MSHPPLRTAVARLREPLNGTPLPDMRLRGMLLGGMSLPGMLLISALLLLGACSAPPAPSGGRVAELQRIELRPGDGPVARAGMDVTVHYSGWLFDATAPDRHGPKFDSSVDRDESFTFLLGAGRVIRGWDEGVAGMRVGGKRVLLIPPEYGYGRKGAGNAIPPDASLVFEVELLGVREH